MSKLLIIVSCILVAYVGQAVAQPPVTQEIPRGIPEDVGLSSAGLKKIDELVQQYIDNGRISGAVVGVSRHGKVVYLQAHGVLEEKTQEPMPEDSIFIMASSTKPVIGVAAMILVDEGLISPQDPVSKYIPEYEGLQVVVPLKSAGAGLDTKKNFKDKSKTKKTSNAKRKANAASRTRKQAIPEYRLEKVDRPLTIHDLLTHTAGVGIRGGLGAVIVDDRAGPLDTLATWVPRMAARPLDFQPGTRSAYSPNDGLKVVGRIIEIVSGMPVNAFIQSRILDPLDMKDTHFDVPEDKLYRMPSKLHNKARGDGRLVGEDFSAYVSGAGGLFSTTRDYLRFQQMLVNGGTLFGHQLLKPETVAMMSTNQVGRLHEKSPKGGPGTGKGYTMGITLNQEKSWSGRLAGTFSWGGAAGTASWTTPSEKLTVVYMAQQPTDLQNRIALAVQDAIIE